MKVLGIIPARYASSRLPGKPLADIAGKPMIQHVYERAGKVLQEIAVATDDERIADAVKGFGGEVIMTSPQHETGTNRCLEAYEVLNKEFDIIINIQGDEPLLEREHLQKIIACFEDSTVEMASLVLACRSSEILKAGDGVFVVMDKDQNALYFSRSVIPFVRDENMELWCSVHTFYKHIGMYAFKPRALKKFATMPASSLENAEKLEQNRWLENGGKIRLGITHAKVISVDTPADLENVQKIIKGGG